MYSIGIQYLVVVVFVCVRGAIPYYHISLRFSSLGMKRASFHTTTANMYLMCIQHEFNMYTRRVQLVFDMYLMINEYSTCIR